MKNILIFISLLSISESFAQMEVNIVDITTNDIVYDAVTNRIYASLPSDNGANGNSIGIINPQTHTLENTVFIGSDPTVLAISDDGQYIYSGFANSSTIRRFDVSTQTAGLQYPLGSDSFNGPFYAADIEVVPGQPLSLAVSRKYLTTSPEFAGVAIYDDGVMRNNVSTWYNGEISNHIEFKNSSTLYGYNNETTGFNFNRLAVNAGGVSLTASYGNMPGNGFNFNLNFIANGNRVYFTEGSVLDVSSTPFVLGQFANAFGPAAFDEVNNFVCYATSDNGVISFKRFNPETFLLNDSLPIADAFGNAISVITCGENCYAFNTTDNKLVIITPQVTAGVAQNNNVTFSVAPNPSSDYVKISSTNDLKIKSADIYSLNGAKTSAILNNNSVDIRGLAQGVYIFKFIDENNNSYTKKIVKI